MGINAEYMGRNSMELKERLVATLTQDLQSMRRSHDALHDTHDKEGPLGPNASKAPHGAHDDPAEAHHSGVSHGAQTGDGQHSSDDEHSAHNREGPHDAHDGQ